MKEWVFVKHYALFIRDWDSYQIMCRRLIRPE